jgi:hypothetical protein
MQVDQEDQPALGEVRVAQALVDRVRVAQRPPGPTALIDLLPAAFRFTPSVTRRLAIVRRRFQWRRMIARNRRRIWASILRIICISEAEAIPKKPCHPFTHALI